MIALALPLALVAVLLPTAAAYNVLVLDAASSAGVAHLRGLRHEVTAKGPLAPAELRAAIGKYDAVVVASSTTVDAAAIREGAAGSLKVIGRAGVGLDNIDCAAAAAAGVAVVTSGAAPLAAASVAEATLAHALALARRALGAHRSLADGEWRRRDFVGTTLRGKTLGIVGYGRIGREVAKLGAAFGMTVQTAARPSRGGGGGGPARAVPMDELIATSDVLALHCPLTDDTRNLIGAAALRTMRPGALLVNMARGGVVDERALLAALEAGDQLGGAALDVFEREGTVEPHVQALARLPNVCLSPHTGASTREAAEEVAMGVARAVLDALDPEPKKASYPFGMAPANAGSGGGA